MKKELVRVPHLKGKDSSRESSGALEEHQRQREQRTMNLTYCGQRVQQTFEPLSGLHGSDKDKADFFFSKAWESY